MKYIKKTLLFCMLALLLTITYWTNCFDSGNGYTYTLNKNSEALVFGTAYADYASYVGYGYGLGWYVSYNSADGNFLNNDEFLNGYGLEEQVIAVSNTAECQSMYAPGEQIQFPDGTRRNIVNVEEQGEYLYLYYDGDGILAYEETGSLLYTRLFDENGTKIISGIRTTYKSSIGLQGNVFRILTNFFTAKQIERVAKLLCALLTGCVVTGICWLLWKKYGKMLATIFYLVFWLSPLVVAFGSNAYWLEGVLLMPLLIGIWLSMNYHSKKNRIIAYVLTFCVIAGKCTCGYEYITVVMMSLIVFLLTDFVVAVAQRKSKEEKLLLLRTIFVTGVCALLGFAAVLLVHGYARGDGNVITGLVDIFENDVLRRTIGGDVSNFDSAYTESLNASVISVLLKYFNFANSTYVLQIVEGIDANLFPVLVLTSVVTLVLGVREKKMGWDVVGLYVWTFLTTISWFVLGKSHSAAHPFLNFILWYFGYIQMMFYVIIRYLWLKIREKGMVQMKDE